MRHLRKPLLASLLITVSAAFTLSKPAEAGSGAISLQASPPPGFDDLSSDRKSLIDVYFGGEKVTEAIATVGLGTVIFDDGAAVAKAIPGLIATSQLAGILAKPLPSNTALACGTRPRTGCGDLAVDDAGVILDEERFRVDLFINPSLLSVEHGPSVAFLADPAASPSLVSHFGIAASGSTGGSTAYHVQNRLVASLGAMRLRSDSAVSSGRGLSFDNLVVELDSADRRYSAGVMWAPGSDLVGRRQILGFGFTTQLDTLVDKEQANATPLPVFLQRPARVEMLVGGRLVSSRIYPAGHRLLDPQGLPNGSYNLVLRIQEEGDSPRTEVRFVSKGSEMAPVGRPQFSFFAGSLRSAASAGSANGQIIYFQGSASIRLAGEVGMDATLLGAGRKAILEGGTTIALPFADVRVAALASTSGDVGGVARARIGGRGRLAASFDLRAVESRDGAPLLPLSSSSGTFSEDPEVGIGARGTYLQGLAILDYRLGAAAFRLTGLYRRDGRETPNYSVGVSADVPLVVRAGWNVRLQADVRTGDRDSGGFLGLRFLKTGSMLSWSGRSGFSYESGRRGGRVRWTGESQGSWQGTAPGGGEAMADAGIGQTAEGAYARGSGYLRTTAVNARSDLLHHFGERRTQYSLALDTGLIIGSAGAAVAAREAADSAVLVAVQGSRPGERFDILVDDAVRGSIGGNGRLAIFLPPYDTYRVRLRPTSSAAPSLVGEEREITLFPGNVARLEWSVTPLDIFLGRALGRRGAPLANAEIRSGHGIGRSDDSGYFQLEARPGDLIEVRLPDGSSCSFSTSGGAARETHVSLGDVTCA